MSQNFTYKLIFFMRWANFKYRRDSPTSMKKGEEKKEEQKQTPQRSAIEEMAIFCKKKGFVFPSSELYGGCAGFFDFGPLGVESLNALKQSWWSHFVQQKENVVGIEASTISHPRTWVASGHVATFGDLVLMCSKCKIRYRADHFIEENLFIKSEGLTSEKIHDLIKKHKLICPKCKGTFADIKKFNLLFKTQVGPVADASQIAYLRGETAQAMFMDFEQVAETARMKLPFGIAQIGRCFRNEISPRDFLFRSREFTIAEIEFFIHPERDDCDILSKEHLALKLMLFSAEEQEKKSSSSGFLGFKKKAKKDESKEGFDTCAGQETTIQTMLKEKRFDTWHAYWLAEQLMWLQNVGLSRNNLRVREHLKTELSHYSSATLDIEYKFPTGFREIAGNANRGQYDLTQHSKESKTEIHVFDEESKKNVVPRVIEPTFGVERVFLALFLEAFENDQKRGNIVLHLNPRLAPHTVALFPLVNKEGLPELALQIHKELIPSLRCFYDSSGSIGRRYARQDEVGTPFCVTIDFDSLKRKDVTIRDRDTTRQVRVKIKDLKQTLRSLVEGERSFKDLA